MAGTNGKARQLLKEEDEDMTDSDDEQEIQEVSHSQDALAVNSRSQK